MNRCVNIDWLQIFAREPKDQPLTADYFRRLGYVVDVRAYGTPQYKEMFTIFQNSFPFIEVRRAPYSIKANEGLFNPNDCHLRLSNRACYSESPVNELRKFMIAHNYEYISTSRIDICLDFNVFDFGDKPEKILKDYMEGKYSKINQCNIAAHGKDSFKCRNWNSLSWGSKKSPISTKMYNKTLELDESHDKFYIRDSWVAAGLRTDIPVWRVEFSIKSDIKGYVRLDDGHLIGNTLNNYDNRHKCLFLFHCLAARYFHFKYVEYMENGQLRRKDRCKDKVLFYIHKQEQEYKPIRLTLNTEPTRTDKILVNRLYKIMHDFSFTKYQRKAAIELIQFFHNEMRFPLSSEKFDNLVLGLEKAVQ